MNCKNQYLKIVLSIAGLSAVPIAIFTLTSCDGSNVKSLVEAQPTPAGLYREYLSETRGQKELSFEDLTAYIGKWQTLKDSVTATMRRDTTYRAHSDIREECILLHDSVRAELSRLAMSKPRTYKEVLILKERFSSYTGDVELHRSAEEIRPFFAELDKRPACRGNKEQILSAYRNVLAETLNNGIHGNGDLKKFIEREDAAFRAFLSGLHELGEANMADITRDTDLTESFGLSIEEEQTVYGAMKGKYPLPLVETAGGVTVVPSCLDLSAAEAELINEPGRELILSGLIAKSLDHRKFDYILIDCPPSLGLLTLNALTAADYLIIPVQAQFLAMRGMAKIMNVIATVQERLNPKLAIGGIVITQFDKRKTLNKSVAELVKDSFCDKVFKTVIRDNVSLAEAPIKGKNIFEYSKNSNGAKDYMALAQEVLKLK